MDEYGQQMYEDYVKAINQNKPVNYGVICPHSFDTKTDKNECVLCSLCKEVLFNRSLPKNDPLKERARSLNAKKRYYSNMIFLSNPSEVVVLEYGEKIFNKLIVGQFDALSEWKNFMHPTQGRNLYITKIKIGSEKKDVDYNVEPRMSISQIPDMSVLNKLYDISEIHALIESGRVQPIYQSKFEFSKTEVRFLPSGDKTKPFLFYKALLWHYNISKEDFTAVQEGRYNPITNVWVHHTNTAKLNVNESMYVPPTYVPPTDVTTPIPPTTSTARTSMRAPQKDQMVDSVSMDNIANDISPWEDVGGVDTYEDYNGEESSKNTIEPICYSQYDPESPICTNKCVETGWAESCKKLYNEKLALRAKARRLSK